MRLFLASVLLLVGFVFYLEFEVRQHFSGNINTQPARIYARPLSISVDDMITPTNLVFELKQRGYVAVAKIASAGDYSQAENVFDIFVRSYQDGLLNQPEQAIRVRLYNNQVNEIMDHRSGQSIHQVFIQPISIGSLQLGPYKDRISLKLHEMPELLIKALLTMEDRRFESHWGVEPSAILRAMLSNIRSGRTVQGGSTITQQLAKNLFLTPRRTLSRKIMEASLAIVIEYRFSKAEILELYLNEVFLGQTGHRAIHGFASASEYFFGRPIEQLKLHETAMLVGMIPAPTAFNPRRHPERAKKRRNLVLHTLAKVSAISQDRANRLSELDLGIVQHKPLAANAFPAFIDYLHRQLRQFYTEDVLRSNGLKLYTSMDSGIQEIAQKQLVDTLTMIEQEQGLARNTLQGAVITVDVSSGDILALVGDRIRGYSGFNRAIDAERPIGSLIKPVVYLAALKSRDYSLVSLLKDSPITLKQEGGKSWSPNNYDKKYRGMIPLYQALQHSYNLPAVRLGLELGLDKVIQTLHQLGIKRDIRPFPSMLLGANEHTVLEVAQMYQTIANQGERIALRAIRSIANKRGKLIAKFPLSAKSVIDKEVALLLDHVLKRVVKHGTAKRLNHVFPETLNIAGKTGTTNDFKDSWFVGYVGNLLTVVWLGRDDNRGTRLTGSSGALRVWGDMMKQLPLLPNKNQVDKNIIMVEVDSVSGVLANHRCNQTTILPFIRGTKPTQFAPCSGNSRK